MPCDSIQQSNVEFLAKATDLKLLKKALEALGHVVTEQLTGLSFYHPRSGISGTYSRATGELKSRGYQELDINEVKRAYSKQVVISTAKAEGWQLTWATNERGEDVASVQKAMF